MRPALGGRSGVAVDHVICVAGISFNGSSVLNLVLDGHPEIYGGGELLKLFRENYSARCSVCQYSCRYWTDRRLAHAPREGLYDYLASIFGSPVIADTSKTIDHFEQIGPLNAGPARSYVLLIKHPIRHLTSYVNNKFIVDEGLLQTVDEGTLTPDQRQDMVEYVRRRATRMLVAYDRTETILGSLAERSGFRLLRYEGFVERPRESLELLLAPAGLEYFPSMLDFASLEHHPIGGNRGAHYQIRKDLPVTRFTSYRKHYYEKNSGIAMDNKYLDTFDDFQLDAIVGLDEYRKLCDRIGYAPDDFPRTR